MKKVSSCRNNYVFGATLICERVSFPWKVMSFDKHIAVQEQSVPCRDVNICNGSFPVRLVE